MLLNKELIMSMFQRSAFLLSENIGFLSEIDSRFGDGDHGVTMGKISSCVLASCDEWQDESIKDFIGELAVRVMGINGGSAGPLYGTLIEGLAAPLSDESEIAPQTLKAMLAGSRDAMFDITKARVGDKTMMDSLIPAVDAALAAPDDIASILASAAEAASNGARGTEDMVSKFGRARLYGEQTLGTRDAGAVSTCLLFEGFARAVEGGGE